MCRTRVEGGDYRFTLTQHILNITALTTVLIGRLIIIIIIIIIINNKPL